MLILISLLVLSPIPLPVPRHAPPHCWDALKQVSLAIEVVGPQERWIDDFQSELGYVRRHWRELQTCPRLSECELLPSRGLAMQFSEFYRQRCAYLEARRCIALHHADELAELLEEARADGRYWALVAEATNDHASWLARRNALAALRDWQSVDMKEP